MDKPTVNPSNEDPSNNTQTGLINRQQPKNCQQLLRYAVQAGNLPENRTADDTTKSAAPLKMSEDRIKFLQDVMSTMSEDPTKKLQSLLHFIISKVQELINSTGPSTASYVDDIVEAFDITKEYIYNLDLANNFERIGGFQLFQVCLNRAQSPPYIIKAACSLLAELCQNNEYCQNVAYETGLIPILLDFVREPVSVACTLYAVSALSSIIRSNRPEILDSFLENNGVETFGMALQSRRQALTTRICFCLNALLYSGVVMPPERRDALVARLQQASYPGLLLNLLEREWDPSFEMVLELMEHLVTANGGGNIPLARLAPHVKDTISELIELRRKATVDDEESTANKDLSILKMLYDRL